MSHRDRFIGASMARRDMEPGTVFGVTDAASWRGYRVERRTAYVVIDAINEVEFWTGARAVFGDVMPSVEFEVLS